ncbi:hypothetical protein F4556_000437 [Kitasatospora gansuensis]|uniref:Uncharacterized protein n=1 Tax=Kitasatospora gansuensis TaxID=258050 RepID=A0A7W7S7D8_9ACTN|nr:hypothetical protein [Kitasatospora gansuensis]MBB4944902.1 hypothetical protein [Kitasatospora gansuensis]
MARNPHDDRHEDLGRPNRVLGPQERAKAAAERLAEIHRYLTDRYAQREVVARTVTPAGQELDWIPVESQLGGGRLPAAPPGEHEADEAPEGERRGEPVRFELELHGAELGPPGTVPVVRTPIERITPVVGLNDWLAKGRRANRLGLPADAREVLPPEDGGDHKYAATAQAVTCYGTDGVINVWDPYVFRSDEF